MSGKSRQSGSPEITIRTLFHTRHYNLIKYAPDQLEELQRRLAKSQFLAAAYRFVQRIQSTHGKRHLTPAQARKRVLKAWAALPDNVKKHFSKFKTAITEHQEEYFANWLDGALTNGVTESKNRALRDIQRAARGVRHEELRLRAIYGVSPTERMMRAKSGRPDPIEQALALINGENAPKQVRTVSRHGRHRPGRRPWKTSPKQQKLLFPE